MAWQHRIADVIVDDREDAAGEASDRAEHRQRVGAGSTNPHPAVSIFNFHYATPPDAVAMNYALNKVIGDNETGFRGTGDAVYRMEALGLPPRRRRAVQQPRLLVHRRPRGRHLQYPATQPGGGSPRSAGS